MKISIINELNKTKLYQTPNVKKYHSNTDINTGRNYNIAFYGIQDSSIITTKIKTNKGRMLNIFKEILSSKTFKTPAELEAHRKQRALNILQYKIKRHQELSAQAEYIMASHPHGLNDIEKRFIEGILHELKKLANIPLYEEPKKSKYDAEDYDFALINLFQKAISNDNFDLTPIYKDYYKKLENIETVEDLQAKYPAIKLPKNPIDSIANRILALIPQEIHESHQKSLAFGDEHLAMISDTGEKLTDFIIKTLTDAGIDIKNKLTLKIGKKIITDFKNIYSNGTTKNYPKKNSGNPSKKVEIITDVERKLLDIDYDKFILSIIKEHYINDKKLNEITYQEGEKIIKVADLKDTEYKFEKKSEKLKKFISDAEKIKLIQRDYARYTQDELKSRLEFYGNSNLCNNEELFNIICDFHACKFIAEDRGYLIKLLNILDKINDKQMSIEDGLKYLKENKIRPLGTHKINSAEKQELKEKLWKEHLLNQTLKETQEIFYETINYLYSNNLTQLVEICTKYYPENADYSEIISSLISIGLIKEIIKNNNTEEAQNKILRIEAYKEFIENKDDSTISKDALAYTKKYEHNEKEENYIETIKSFIGTILPENLNIKDYNNLFLELENISSKEKIGQYILNRNVVEGYPESKDLVPYPQILDKIMQNFGDDKNLATELLCKYHDYYSLDSEAKSFVANILKIFDLKDNNNKFLLKEIIETDFINSDTYIFIEEDKVPKKRTIASTAKKEIYDKHFFPGSMFYFEKFEYALPLKARSKNSSGVKKVDRNNEKSLYKTEVKIAGYDARLVADNDDYYFNHYLPDGIH